MRRQKFIWVVIFFSIAVFYIYQAKLSQTTTSSYNGTIFSAPQALPQFELMATTGGKFNNQNLKHKWHLLFFGYSKCPEICPARLATLKALWQVLAKYKIQNKINAVFISLQPEVDETTRLSKFLANYNKDFIGLTGSKAAVEALSKPIGIFAATSTDEFGNKIINHSSTFLLVDSKGNLAASFSANLSIDEIAADLLKLIN